jgi:lipoate-protein ligase A
VVRVPRTFDGPLDGAAYMEGDETALRSGAALVRCAYFSAACLSIGIGERADGTVARAARRAGLPLVQRGSGGSGLLHLPGDLLWSIVLPRSSALVGRDFVHAYERLGSGVVDGLRALGLTARWSPPFDRSERYCLLGPRGRVLTVGGRAIGGAAQHLTRTALLHHGVVNRGLDRDRLGELFGLPPELLDQTVTSLEAEGVAEAPEALARRLLDALGRAVDGAAPPP